MEDISDSDKEHLEVVNQLPPSMLIIAVLSSHMEFIETKQLLPYLKE